MATVISARRRGPVRGPTKPPNQTVEAFAEEMINGILCHYEPPDPGIRRTSKNRSILRKPSFGNAARSRSDLTTAMSNISVTSHSSTATPPVKKKNVRWIDADYSNKSSSSSAAAARAIITAPVSRCSNAGNRMYDASVDVGCLSPSSAGGQGNNNMLSPSDTTNGGGSTTIWSTMSEESEIPCRRSRALKDAVYDEDGNPVSSRPGSNNNLPAPPLTPPPPRRKEVFIPELCGVRINCFEDEEQMEELSRHPYGRTTPSPATAALRRGHSVDYEDEENSLTHENERAKSGDRRQRNSTNSSSRSRRLSSSTATSVPANNNEPRDSDSVESRDEVVDIKSDSNNKKSNHTRNSNNKDSWEEASSPPASGSNARPSTYGPPDSFRRDDSGESINQAANPGNNTIDPVMMSRASSEVNAPQDRQPQLQKQQQQQQQKQQQLEVVNEDDDWDQSIPIVPSLSDPPPVKDEETQTSPMETSANKLSSSSNEKSKKSTDRVKKEATGSSIERAKVRAAEKIKKKEERKKHEEKKAAAKQKSIDEKKREAEEKKSEERRRLEGSKETKLSERAAEDLRKIEDAKTATEDLKKLEQLRMNEVSKLAEQVRRTEENIDEELKKADELRKIEERKIAEELKRAEEIRADAMRRAVALMKMERAKEAILLQRLEAARNADLQKLSEIDPTDSLGYYADIASQGSVILSTQLAQGRSSSGIRRGRKQEPRKRADDKDSRRRSFDPLLLMRRSSRSRSPGRSKSPRRSKSPIRPGLFRRRQTIDSVAYDDEYITSSASRSYSPGNSDAGLNEYGLKKGSFGTASTVTDAERNSYVNAHRESVESNMQVSRQRAARAQRNQYLGHPPMPHLHPAHPLNQYRQNGQHGRVDEIMERQSFITAHRQGFDPLPPSRMDDDSMDRQSFITAHREGFEVLTSRRRTLDDDRESYIMDHRRGFESLGLKHLGGEATHPVAQPDFVVETAISGDDSMGLTSPISVGSTGSASAGSTSVGSPSVDISVLDDLSISENDDTIPEPPKVRPTLTPPKEEPEKKEEEMTWEEKTRLAWERIRNGFGLSTTEEETTEEVPALKASEDSCDAEDEKLTEQPDKPRKVVSESKDSEINATPPTPPLSPRISPGHSPNLSPSRRRPMSSPRKAMEKLFQSSAPREPLPQQQQQRPKGILKTPTPEKRVTFGHDSEKIFADGQDENKPSPRSMLSSPMNAHVHPHIQHGQMYMPHSHGPHPSQQQQPLQPQPHLQQPMGTPPIDKKKVKRVFRGTKLITHIFKTKSPQGKSSPRGSKSPRGRSPLRSVPHHHPGGGPSPTPPHLRSAGSLVVGGTASASLDSTRSTAGSSYQMNTYTTSDAPSGTKPGAGNYSLAAVQQNGMSPLGSRSYSLC